MKGKFATYKEGPIEIGRNHDWEPAEYNVEDDGKDFLAERMGGNKKDNYYAIYKEGPRDIGYVKGWKPYKHKRDDSGRHFLAEKVKRMQTPDTERISRKPGPRGYPEIARKRSSITRSAGRAGTKRKSTTGSRSSRKDSSRSSSEKRTGRRKRSDHRKKAGVKSPEMLMRDNSNNLNSADFRLLEMDRNWGGGSFEGLP